MQIENLLTTYIFRILICLLVLSATAAETTAQSPVDLNWSGDGQQFIYQSNDNFYLVDVKSRSKDQIDNERIVKKTGTLDSASFSSEQNELILRSGDEFFRLDRTTDELVRIDRPQNPVLPARLQLPPVNSIDGGQQTTMLLENRLDKPIQMVWVDSNQRHHDYGKVEPNRSFSQHTYVGHAWLLIDSANKQLGSFRVRENETLIIDSEMIRNVNRKRNRQTHPSSSWKTPSVNKKSPDGNWTVSVRNHNIWANDLQLTNDANSGHTFLNTGMGTHWFPNPGGPEVRWSPNSKFLVAFQTANPPEPRVNFIESTPADQIQPKLQSYQYAKPGDALPTKTLRLFDVVNEKEIPISNVLFKNPWSIRLVRWVDQGEKFWLHYNQRGHQAVRLIEVTTATGEARTLIEEVGETFIHYSNGAKSVFQPLPGNRILWSSERTGWNHLYRFDAESGELVNAITSGEWNVKQIDHVDRENGVIWLYAVGLKDNQDPYHEHFCRVDFDGRNFKVLTDGDGTHRVAFEKNKAYLIDTYSRVDLAPVTELRDATTGELIIQLEARDTQDEFGERKLTTRFCAKGRDGETDIWGIIHWPTDFSPDSKYPVVEQIYAGPHGYHVPKSFRKNYFIPYQFADAGMIVVQIDGMGTAWRSKKFHDVCYKNLKDGGFPDRIAWLKAAAQKYPQLDLQRVGIFGGSAGGQNAMAALLWHNDFYKVAVADCGCHDNRMDKIWWNEQWMGWPVDESYAKNSNMENAHLLKGHLMLTVGEMDRNVDPATTIQVVKKLIEHNKDFEFVLLPGQGHGAGDSPWAARKRLNFFKRYLMVDQ